jgi:excisionase family DNA binding protein
MLDERKLQALRELLDPEVVAAWLDEVESCRTHKAVPRKQEEVRLLTTKEVSEKLQVSLSAVYELAHRQDIPTVRIGRNFRFSSAMVDEWIESGGIPPIPARSRRRNL